MSPNQPSKRYQEMLAMITECCLCGGPVDPLLLNMDRKCFDTWIEAGRMEWVHASRRRLEEFRMKVAA